MSEPRWSWPGLRPPSPESVLHSVNLLRKWPETALEHFHFYSAQASAAKCGFS
jgi:hypothetical protein